MCSISLLLAPYRAFLAFNYWHKTEKNHEFYVHICTGKYLVCSFDGEKKGGLEYRAASE